MSINMDPDFFSDLPNGERDANALDRALDDFVRGRRRQVNRLEPGLVTTVDRMFALAEVSGMAGAIRTRPTRRLLPWKAGIPMKQIVSVISTAAVVIVLAIGINASVPGFRDQHAGLGTAVPTSDADTQILAEPLTSSDCNVEPRSRAEIIEILSQAPSVDASLSDRETPPVEADEETTQDIQTTIRAWQACWRYGDLWSTYSIESAQYIRRSFYASERIDVAYSPSTLEELITGAERAYANRGFQDTDLADPWEHATWFEMSPDNIRLTENKTIAHVNLQRFSVDGPVEDEELYAVLVLEEGRWRIWMVERAILF